MVRTRIATALGNSWDDWTAPHGQVRFDSVSACDMYGNCSLISAGNNGYPGLAAPTDVEASDGTYKNYVWISWDEVDGATSYEVRVGDQPSSYFKTLSEPGGGTTYTYDHDLDPGVLHYFWVRATNLVDEGELSSYDTGYRRLDEPSNVEATDGAYWNKTRVTWEAVEAATSYKVRRGTGSGWDQEWPVPSGTAYDDYYGTFSTPYLAWCDVRPQVSADFHQALSEVGYDSRLITIEGATYSDLPTRTPAAIAGTVQRVMGLAQGSN